MPFFSLNLNRNAGAGITQGKSSSLPFLNSKRFTRFRNDRDKRDFVSGV
jgi:hypothetical protein